VPSRLAAVACFLAALVVAGCASSGSRVLNDPSSSSSTPDHGSLTDREFNVAVAVARAETQKYEATVTSATATVGVGTVTDPNAGPACTSGTLLHIKLIGTFPTIVVGGSPTGAPGVNNDYTVTAVLITADPESGKPCDISVQTGSTSPDPGATVLFTDSGSRAVSSPPVGVVVPSGPVAAASGAVVTSGASSSPFPTCSGFALSLASGRGGQSSPINAAVWFAQHGAVQGIPEGGWKEVSAGSAEATVQSGGVRLHVIQGPDQTWQVDSGQYPCH